MSERYKTWADGRAYSVTLTVVGWIDLFTRRACADEIITNLTYCIRHKNLRVWAWCLMPSHLHLLAAAPADQRLSDILHDFKSYTAKRLLQVVAEHPRESRREWLDYLFRYYGKGIGQEHQLWQPGMHPIVIDSEARAQQKRDYIHLNPVRAGLVTEATGYAYSSANPQHPLELARW